MIAALQDWLSDSPLPLIAFSLFAATLVAAGLGMLARRARDRVAAHPAAVEGQEGYVVSAVLGLLALLTGFTFSLAVDRFDTRKQLVLQEANAIGAVYLRAQLLDEPHRARMSTLIRQYTDNRVELAKAPPAEVAPLLARSDAMVTDIWTAAVASFPSVKGLDFSSAYVESVNELVSLDASRKAARGARVPAAIFGVLFVYTVVAAGVLGYVLVGLSGQLSATFLLALTTLSLVLIVDIDRPTQGTIVEGQAPMETLQQSLARWPPAVFDRWKAPPPAP